MREELLGNGENLDQEWVDLILSALDMGMTVQQIKEFFANRSTGVNTL